MALHQSLHLHSLMHHQQLKQLYVKSKNPELETLLPELETLLPEVRDYSICWTQISMINFCNHQLTL
jgi:hypothetical protein